MLFDSSRAKIRTKLPLWAFRVYESRSSAMVRLPRKNHRVSYLQFAPFDLTDTNLLEPHRKFSPA